MSAQKKEINSIDAMFEERGNPDVISLSDAATALSIGQPTMHFILDSLNIRPTIKHKSYSYFSKESLAIVEMEVLERKKNNTMPTLSSPPEKVLEMSMRKLSQSKSRVLKQIDDEIEKLKKVRDKLANVPE